MEARETDIAPKVTARIAKVRVTEGQKIQPGDLLVEMDSPEVRAKLAQAEAARDAAQAQADKAQAGARSEEHTSELQSQSNLVCRLLLEKKKKSRPSMKCASAFERPSPSWRAYVQPSMPAQRS